MGMHEITGVETMIAGLAVGVTKSAAPTGLAKLTPLHREMVETLPRTLRQEVRVLHAVLQPGDVTPYHSHRFPVTVYMTAGTFTLQLDDRAPVELSSGSVFVEPAGVGMTGRNKGISPTEMVLFYVCEPDAPFANPLAAEPS
jgi:quercetin dioxygenase-like cupin family protein